ncbi:MAG: hypothetical protein VW307_09895 [Alphaproteobacteria bacterium]
MWHYPGTDCHCRSLAGTLMRHVSMGIFIMVVLKMLTLPRRAADG